MHKFIKVCFAAATLSSLTVTANAGILYLNDGDGQNRSTSVYAVDTDTGNVISSWATVVNNRTFPIAVHGDVRTTGYTNSETGAQYDLNGNDLGGRYTLTGSPRSFSDGTSDGSFNYASSWVDGGIYQLDRDWSNASLLFNAGSTAGGVSYNPLDDSFWVSSDRSREGQTEIRNYDRTGNLVFSFLTPEVSSMNWNLAFDAEDSTLWIGGMSTNTMYQYSTAGGFLGELQLNLPFSSAASFYSAEFNLGNVAQPVSEPGALALLGLGLIGMRLARKKQKKLS